MNENVSKITPFIVFPDQHLTGQPQRTSLKIILNFLRVFHLQRQAGSFHARPTIVNSKANTLKAASTSLLAFLQPNCVRKHYRVQAFKPSFPHAAKSSQKFTFDFFLILFPRSPNSPSNQY